MADPYRLLLHPELAKELQGLRAAAREDPKGLPAEQFKGLKDGLLALRSGRESDFGGKRMHSLTDQYGDISDCAEIKVPVVREFAPNGYEFGPSHRLTYREFEGTQQDPTPVREAIAFEPRKEGRPFEVTANRLNRAVGVSLADLSPAQQQNANEAAPVRQKLPNELAAMMFARPATEAVGNTPGKAAAVSSNGPGQTRGATRPDPTRDGR